jgi:hypothetical protein
MTGGFQDNMSGCLLMAPEIDRLNGHQKLRNAHLPTSTAHPAIVNRVFRRKWNPFIVLLTYLSCSESNCIRYRSTMFRATCKFKREALTPYIGSM